MLFLKFFSESYEIVSKITVMMQIELIKQNRIFQMKIDTYELKNNLAISHLFCCFFLEITLKIKCCLHEKLVHYNKLIAFNCIRFVNFLNI